MDIANMGMSALNSHATGDAQNLIFQEREKNKFFYK